MKKFVSLILVMCFSVILANPVSAHGMRPPMIMYGGPGMRPPMIMYGGPGMRPPFSCNGYGVFDNRNNHHHYRNSSCCDIEDVLLGVGIGLGAELIRGIITESSKPEVIIIQQPPMQQIPVQQVQTKYVITEYGLVPIEVYEKYMKDK